VKKVQRTCSIKKRFFRKRGADQARERKGKNEGKAEGKTGRELASCPDWKKKLRGGCGGEKTGKLPIKRAPEIEKKLRRRPWERVGGEFET